MQQYIDNFGWHPRGSPFSNVNWDDLRFKSTTAIVNHPVDGSSKDSCNDWQSLVV
ncbi:MAG: hypothetical protein U5L96_07995 [Owenweeksia sp.]|nr:hypothetical protein [Owenweeksia sp.]